MKEIYYVWGSSFNSWEFCQYTMVLKYLENKFSPPSRKLVEKTIEHNAVEAVVATGLDMLAPENTSDVLDRPLVELGDKLYSKAMSYENYETNVLTQAIWNDARALDLDRHDLLNIGRGISGKIEKTCGAFTGWLKAESEKNKKYRYVYEKKFYASDNGIDDRHGIATKPDFVVGEKTEHGWLVYPLEVKSGESRYPYHGELLQLTAEMITVGRNDKYMDKMFGEGSWRLHRRPKMVFSDGKMSEIDFTENNYEDEIWQISRQIRNIDKELAEGHIKPSYRCSSCFINYSLKNGKPACDKAP